MVVGVPLQIAYLANVTPGGAVAWDLSYATYIGTAMALALKGTVSSPEALIGLAFTGAGVGGGDTAGAQIRREDGGGVHQPAEAE